MSEINRIWTTVGSAGTLNQADLGKVTLYQSIIQLGIEIVSPPLDPVAARATSQAGGASAQIARKVPTVQAVARYNVVPVDGLFFQPGGSSPFSYGLQLRYHGHVNATLMEVDLTTGAETGIIAFDSAEFPATSGFQVQTAFAKSFAGVLDFTRKAYYVEATLIVPELVLGHASAISIVKLIAKRPDF